MKNPFAEYLSRMKMPVAYAWIACSLVLLFVMLSAFVLPEKVVYDLAPECEWKVKYDKECFACGLTRGFVNISDGNFETASDANSLSVYLFLIFAFNEIIALSVSYFMFFKPLILKLRSEKEYQHANS